MEGDFNYNRVWVLGLIVECPFGTPLSDCPANDIRKLPLSERIKIVKRMSDEQHEEIMAHHKECLKKREH